MSIFVVVKCLALLTKLLCVCVCACAGGGGRGGNIHKFMECCWKSFDGKMLKHY